MKGKERQARRRLHSDAALKQCTEHCVVEDAVPGETMKYNPIQV